ncbi:MAG: hypothetical protein IT312_16380 [Anaerolineales bacterium]|nr:hypothetical protein [Anaerolineales bacterium]
MEQITIRVKDKKKAQTLLDYLKSLDFIESVSEQDLPAEKQSSTSGADDFFSMAGFWAERNVSLQSIREQAWLYRA